MATALRVFLPFALTYLLAYTLRVVNAVAGEPISQDLGLTTADLGFLTSVYLAGFALCQLPFGVLMDRYGPRRVEASLLILAAAGCAVFALASSFFELVAGRIMMGVGASMCLMAPFTAYRKWFTMERLPFVIGLHMTFGAAGSALGGWPAEFVIEAVGLRGNSLGDESLEVLLERAPSLRRIEIMGRAHARQVHPNRGSHELAAEPEFLRGAENLLNGAARLTGAPANGDLVGDHFALRIDHRLEPQRHAAF